jgi:hypothetical protein
MAVGLELGSKLGRVDPDGSSWDWFGIAVGLELGSKLGSDDPDGCCSWDGKAPGVTKDVLEDKLSKLVGSFVDVLVGLLVLSLNDAKELGNAVDASR